MTFIHQVSTDRISPSQISEMSGLSPRLSPSGPRRIRHSSICPYGENMSRMSFSLHFLEIMPMKSFLSSTAVQHNTTSYTPALCQGTGADSDSTTPVDTPGNDARVARMKISLWFQPIMASGDTDCQRRVIANRGQATLTHIMLFRFMRTRSNS